MIGLLPWWLFLLILAAAVFANWSLLSLFYRRKGLLFATMGLLFHQLYYLYSSFAFVYSWLEYRVRGTV